MRPKNPPSLSQQYRVETRDRRKGTTRGLMILALFVATAIILLISSIPLTIEQQSLFVLASLGLSLLIRPHNELARYRVIMLILISVIATGRYIYWRLTESLGWFDPNLELTFLDYLFSAGLLFAELYAWTVLFLGFFQTIWPLRRKVQPLPADRSLWPTIDIMIPTYNEPLKVVAPSILGAMDLDWPRDKLNVYVLDDGCREEFARFAREAGAHYIKRESSEGAKAGNINHALRQTRGELVTIFDSDHVPVRSFLLNTVGWFLRERELGLLQTPHLFFTPDPVERNLQVFHQVPNEGQLFYGLVQDGNDSWNAAFFCGSCAVIRRTALEDIGGIATDTVTEDAHTSLLIQRKGWNSGYLNVPLAAGLATERLSAHIGQRMRWARGMLQIFRKDNPLLARGLSLAQRLCYFNAMLHFLFSIPRIIFLTAPLAYLYFEAYVIQASAVLIAIYALPHIFQAQVANSVMQGRYRHSFWADVYETILSAHLIRPTLTALVRPDKGSFNVTSKGGIINEDYFDWSSSKVIFLLLVLNLVGLAFAFLRLFWWNPDETGTVLINLAWTIYNSIILGAAISVAWEKRQRRDDPRIHRKFDAFVIPQNGRRVRAETRDISLVNISLHVPPDLEIARGERITIEITDGQQTSQFPGIVATTLPRHLGVSLTEMPVRKQADLVYFSLSREHSWDDWYTACEPSKPLASFMEIIRLGIFGAFRAVFGHTDDPERNVMHHSRAKSYMLALALVILGILVSIDKANAATPKDVAQAVVTTDTEATPTTSATTAEAREHINSQYSENLSLSLADLGLEKPLVLRGGNSQDDIWFHVRADRIVKQAELRLNYSIARQLLEDYSAISITLNAQPVSRIEITEENVNKPLVDVFNIEPLDFSDLNQLSFKLIPRDEETCEKLDPLAISAEIQPDSDITLHMNPLDLVNELSLFPVPFYDYRDDNKLILPMVLGDELTRSLPALKAAAILASWFGAKADYLGASFPVFNSTLPLQHAIVFRTPESEHADISPLPITGPSLEVMGHPQDSATKLLVISGRTGEDLVTAVRGLVSGQLMLSGNHALVDSSQFTLESRQPYDAPRWLRNRDKTYLSELIEPGKLTSTGISPETVRINFRMAPDLLTWQNENIPLHLNYEYSDLPLESGSTLDVGLNGEWLASLDLDGQTRKEYRVSADEPETEIRMIKRKRLLELPVRKMVGLNQLSFYPNLILPESAALECADDYINFMVNTIERTSHLDLSDHYHFTRMPDLAKFANLGFPYSRYADLSETAVILPNAPTNDEIQFLLNSMGVIGAATGYPAVDVTLLFPADSQLAINKDILLIGSDDRQPLAETWSPHIAINQNMDREWTLRKLTPLERASLWWKGEKLKELKSARRTVEENKEGLTALTGFRSPLNDQRSVIMLVTSTPEMLSRLNDAMTEPEEYAKIQGDLSIIDDTDIKAFRTLPSYYVGELPWYQWIRWYLSTHILALILLTIIAMLITALLLRSLLTDHASERLAPSH